MTTARPGSGKSKSKSERRGGALRPLAGSLAKVAGKTFGRRGLAEGGLIADWPDIVGPEIASVCLPSGIAFARSSERTQGTLTLRVQSGHGLTLQHLEPLIVERINAHLGYPAVARLRLRQGPLPRPKGLGRPEPPALSDSERSALEERTAQVEDPQLRRALESLGRSVLGENARKGGPSGTEM